MVFFKLTLHICIFNDFDEKKTLKFKKKRILNNKILKKILYILTTNIKAKVKIIFVNFPSFFQDLTSYSD